MNNQKRRREVNSLLDYSNDDIIFEHDEYDDECDKNNNQNNKNNHDKYDDYDDSFGSHNKKKKDKNKDKKSFNNPVIKLIREHNVYDKNSIYKALVKQDGLYKMIRDLKEWAKDPKHNKRPAYISNILRDVVVAAALPDAIDDVLKSGKYDLKKDDFDPLLDEIHAFIRNSNSDSQLNSSYSKETIEAMREAYTSILYKFNKKKVKKFKELSIDEGISKKLVILTAGKNPNSSIYSVLRFLYNNANQLDLSEKMLIKIFKICYGKDSMPEVIKCIMNEKVIPMHSSSPLLLKNNTSYAESDMYALIDKLMLDQLEKMGTKEMKRTILAYVKERKLAKKRGDTIRRRFGDRRCIHPEDYAKLTKVLDELENDDFSIIEYLR